MSWLSHTPRPQSRTILQGQAHKIRSCGIFEIPDLFLWSCWPEARAKTQDRRWAKSEPWWLLGGQAERPFGHYNLQLTQAAPAPAPHLALVTRNTLLAHGVIVRELKLSSLLWYWFVKDVYQHQTNETFISQ